jgi:hypothetical protein
VVLGHSAPNQHHVALVRDQAGTANAGAGDTSTRTAVPGVRVVAAAAET